jgi:hypothetical protein
MAASIRAMRSVAERAIRATLWEAFTRVHSEINST